MAELGVGYISIVPEVSKISPNVAKALNGLDPVADKSGQSMGGKLSSALGKTLKASVAGAGLAAGGVIATAIGKGMGRLTGIENAQASLRGLGHDTQSVQSIMDNALASVSGTAFGLEAAAGVAASAVAAGIKPGKDLERTLKVTGDAATIAGIEMGEMGSIINKVATSDMMQMDVANQLMDAGIPILQMVADEMGVTADEARKLASDGKVSFETFQNALEKGVGGAALEAGNTFQGALANMGAALGRVGATALEPFFDLSKQGFGVATAALDNLNAAIKPMAANMSEWLQGVAVPGLIDFKDRTLEAWNAMRGSAEVQSLVGQTGVVIGRLVEAGRELAPVMVQVGSAIGKASAALGVGTWQLALTGLEGIGIAAELATPPLKLLSSLMEQHPGIVTAAVAAYAGFKTLPGIMDKINPVMTKISDGTKTGASNMKLFGQTFGEAYGYMREANPEMSRTGAALRVLGGSGGVAAAGFDKLKGAANGVMGLFGGPWGVALAAAGVVITGVVQANQKAEAAQAAMAAAARDSASAQSELQAAVAGTTGVLDEQAIAAAARVAGNSLADFVEQGEAVSGMIYKVQSDATLLERAFGHMDYQADVEATRELRDSYKALEGAMKDLGLPMDDLNRIVAEGGAEYAGLMGTLRGLGDEGNAAADKLEATRTTLDRMIQAARDVDPAAAQAAAGIDVLADSSSSANDKLGALRSVLQAMGLAPKDAELAMRDAADAIDEIVESATNTEIPLENMGAGLVAASESMDWSHDGWKELSKTLGGMAGDLENVAINGGDVQGTMERQGEALDALAQQYGVSREEMDAMAHSMGLVPEEIAVLVKMEGLNEATTDLQSVYAALYPLEEGTTIDVGVISDDARDSLEQIGYKTRELENGNIEVTASTEEAQEQLGQVVKQMIDLDGLDVSPELFLNDRQLVDSAANAQGILDALAIQEPTPEAKIIIDQLLAGVDISQGQLNFLATQTPTPVADLERSLLENGVTVSSQMLTALHNQLTRPTLDADGRPAFAAVDAVKNKMAEVKDKTVDIRIREWREYYTSGAAVSTSGTSVGQHYGATGGRFDPKDGFAYLPAYATGARHGGYKLPSSGPGTEVTDGFLAVDQVGMPIARLDKDEWVINGRSSDKYNRALAMINRDDPKIHHLARFEDGGRADGGEQLFGRSAEEILRYARGETVFGETAARSLEGAIYDFGGINWGDCSAAVSSLARFAVGLAPMAARFATGNQRESLASMGFAPGLGGPNNFNVGWFNGGPWGGHTSATIAGTNVEMGGARGNGQIGGGAAPASHPQYTDHAHLVLSEGGGAEGVWNAVDPGMQWSGSDYSTTPSGSSYAGGSSGASRSSSKTPTSWSELAGLGAKEFVSGQVQDALGVFGLSDSPGFLNAYGEWVDATSLEEEQETINKIDEEKIAKLERDIEDAKADLKIKRMKVDELSDKATPSSRESANQAVAKAERKIEDLEKELEKERQGTDYEVKADGTLGSKVKEQVTPSDKQKPPQNVQQAIDDAMLAVVGRRPAPSVIPQAVLDMLGAIPAFKDGGWVSAPGGPRDDLGLARVSDTEFIVNAGAAQRNRGLLERINAGETITNNRGGDTYNIHGADPNEVARRIKAQMMVKTMQLLGG